MPISKLFRRKKPKPQNTSPKKNGESAGQPLSYSNVGPEQMGPVIAKSTNLAFQEAWEQHWTGLDESEKADWSFKGAHSLFNVHKTIEDMDKGHRRQTASRRIAGPALRFLKAIETVMAGATIGIQAYPDVSSIVVGVVRVIINVAVKYFEYYDKLSKMLEGLVDDIQVLDMFTQNNTDSPELHDTLVALYTNILAFCRHAHRVFIKQGQEKGASSFAVLAKVQWAPFEEEFGEIRSNLNRYTAKLDRVTAAITMNTTLAISEDLKKTSPSNAQNERREFLDWICVDKIEEVHDMVCQRRLAGTGSSFFQRSAYQKWASETSTRPLWIYGEAGTGKSVLASMVIDRFSQDHDQKDEAVAYVYIKGEDTNLRNSPDRIISMLIKQVCWKLETLPAQTLDYYRQCKKDARLPVLNKLISMFMECAGSLSRVFVIIDALDECEEKFRKPLLDFICETSQQSNSKFLVTSRWEGDIKRAFYRMESRIILEVASDREDIAKVVKYRVEKELGHFKPDIQDYIIQQLVERSGNIFLWVDFQLNDLAHVLESDVKAQLSQLPSNLHETYAQHLRKINAQPITSKNLAQRCFLWAFHTDYLLSSHQFFDAVSLVNDHERIEYRPLDLMEVTRKLIWVSAIGFGRVRPYHFSFREFMLDSQSELPRELQSLAPDRETANARLAIECLRNLLADIPPVGGFPPISTILFYCAQHFDAHIRRLTTIPEKLLQMLDRILLKETHKLLKILSWRWPCGVVEELWPDIACMGDAQSIDPMFFLRCTKLDQVPAIRARFATIERIETYPDGYLHIAAVTGLVDVVCELIERGVDPNREDSVAHGTALQALVSIDWETSEETVMMLLEAGADPDKATAGDMSPYELAQQQGRTKLLHILDSFKSTKNNEISEDGIDDKAPPEEQASTC